MPDNRGLHSHHSRSVPSVHAAAAAVGVGGGLGGPPYPDHYSSKASLHDGSDRPVGGGNLNRHGLCALGQAKFFFGKTPQTPQRNLAQTVTGDQFSANSKVV